MPEPGPNTFFSTPLRRWLRRSRWAWAPLIWWGELRFAWDREVAWFGRFRPRPHRRKGLADAKRTGAPHDDVLAGLELGGGLAVIVGYRLVPTCLFEAPALDATFDGGWFGKQQKAELDFDICMAPWFSRHMLLPEPRLPDRYNDELSRASQRFGSATGLSGARLETAIAARLESMSEQFRGPPFAAAVAYAATLLSHEEGCTSRIMMGVARRMARLQHGARGMRDFHLWPGYLELVGRCAEPEPCTGAVDWLHWRLWQFRWRLARALL